MSDRIQDLWRTNDDPRRYYQLYLAQLLRDERYERIIFACRRIRHYAKRGPGVKEGLFTFYFELDALCELKYYRAAWLQLRRLENHAFGKRFELTRGQFPPSNGMTVFSFYSPILYFLRRNRLGCDMLENELDLFFKGERKMSYEMFCHVANGWVRPSSRHLVTLSHFYRRLGKKLHEWKHWKTFVNGFHPSFYRILGVDREILLADCQELPAFLDKLNTIRRNQIKHENGWAILLKSPRKARPQTESAKRKREQINTQNEAAKSSRNAKLQELFPELRGLLK
jgi:hypothetical protein